MARQPLLTDYEAGYDYELNETGDKRVVQDSEDVALLLKQRLQTFYGEWAFDTTAGVLWFQKVFTRPGNLNLINSLVKRHILQTPGVASLVEYDSTFDFANRKFTVTFRYSDIYQTEGNLSITVP